MEFENIDSSYAEGQDDQLQAVKSDEKNILSQNEESFTHINENIDEVENSKIINVEKELYDEVLDKLDIQKKNVDDIQNQNVEKTQIVQNNFQNSLIKSNVEKAIKNDFIKIQQMQKAGLINSAQGQNLQKQVLRKAFDTLVQAEKSKTTAISQNSVGKNSNEMSALEDFTKTNPDFFNANGRKEVYEFLKTGVGSIGKDELNKISEIVRIVEKSAIDRYLQKVSYEKTLKDSNETAKKRLTANAQKSRSAVNLSRNFTREQIGKMSSAEFTKYESQIMEQLKKGLIK